jgi:hypothetical protein
MAPISIPQFLLPRGIPSSRTLHALTRRRNPSTLATTVPSSRRCASSDDGSKPRVLAKPDKFRPPSHPARRVVPTRNGRVVSGPINYPGPRLSEKEKEEQKTREYPNMFPPEGTIMYNFLTSRWIHIWIAMVGFFPLTLRWLETMADAVACLGRPHLAGYVHLHHELQAFLAVRAFAAAVVCALDSPDRHDRAGAYRLPHACTA